MIPVVLVLLLIAALVIIPKVFAWFALAWTMWKSEPTPPRAEAKEWTPPPNNGVG